MKEQPTCIALDFETADYLPDSACSVGLVRIEENTIVDSTYFLIRPPRKSEVFTYIHGLYWSMLCNQPIFKDVWPKIQCFIQESEYLIAHNASFDRKVLCACLKSIKIDYSVPPFLCTLKGARASLHLPHNRLNDVCDYFGIALDHHNAKSDALACAEIYLRLRNSGVSIDKLKLKS